MINEKISLRTWIEAAADQGVPLHTYLLKLSSEELELSEDAILEQMQTMLQVMEESAAFGLTGVSSHSGLTGGAAKKLQEARRSENYKNILDIAEENQDKSFVYVYDNFFNHMQSVSEMMIYKRTLIINVNNNYELHCVIDDNSLNTEDSYILSIKSYMDNDSILDRIKNESEFKNITLLYKAEDGSNSNVVMDNLYLVSK